MILTLTHANTKAPIYVAKPLVFAYYFSDVHKCTHVLAAGGAIVPVIESVETIRGLMEGPTQ